MIEHDYQGTLLQYAYDKDSNGTIDHFFDNAGIMFKSPNPAFYDFHNKVFEAQINGTEKVEHKTDQYIIKTK